MSDLNDRLASAPREASPGMDLWPAIALRLERRPWSRTARVAAALALFAAGGAAGIAYERGALVRERAPQPSSAFQTAVAVQHAGSEYLAAISRLRALDVNNTLIRDQGYEAAMIVLAAAAEEVTSAAPIRGVDLVNEVHRAHRTTVSKVLGSLERGGR